jgi:hypothetical protein
LLEVDFIVTLIDRNQGRGYDDEGCEHQARGENALRKKEMGCDQKVAQENQYQQVAVTFAFEKLERSHDRQQCEACIASNDGPVLSEYTNSAEKNQWYHYPLRHFTDLVEILQAAPTQ